jgi:D-alanyl-D-alanine carboxypeptidase/D-alanyl-D-alanine-endopeptidase (penicillin-binding protein 4)
MPRLLIAALAGLALLAPSAQAQTSLERSLASKMSSAGPSSGAYVMDSETDEVLFSWRPTGKRILASNTKLFTSAAALGRHGAESSLATTLLGRGYLREDGVWQGNLYLRGGGDPTFGTRSFNRGYGSTASVETLAEQLAAAGFVRVTGHVYGDESLFDRRRGGPDSGYGVSSWVGPISALNFNHGYGPGGFLNSPPTYAAERLDKALQAEGINVRGKPGLKVAPDDAVVLTEVRSPSVGRMIRSQNKPSDNFFAEMLMKGLAVSGRRGGPVRQASDPLPQPPAPSDPPAELARAAPLPGPATLPAGTRVAMRFARGFGSAPRLVDGSGLARGNKASPRSVARLLDRMRDRPDFRTFRDSLPIAGVDGTLDNRMRRGAARKRCRAKTGTISGVSALSGYCATRGGRTVVFSFLMNRVNVYGARNLQDRMANAIARWRG